MDAGIQYGPIQGQVQYIVMGEEDLQIAPSLGVSSPCRRRTMLT